MSVLKGSKHIYTIDDNWKAAGNCQWIIGECDGQRYFIKRFPTPKRPDLKQIGVTISPKQAEDMKAACNKWEKEQSDLIKALSEHARPSGNLVVPLDLFYQGTTYYKVTYAVDTGSLTPEDISKLPFEEQLLFLRTLIHSVRILHRCKIVHGDLKPDNILVSRSETGAYISKLIDFDDSYFEGIVPSADAVVGTYNYYSPELSRYVQTADPDCDEVVDSGSITRKSDIFALGLIFHEYLTGKHPEFDHKYKYACASVLDGKALSISIKVPENISKLIKEMLDINPEKRPDVEQVFKRLTGPTPSPAPSPTPDPVSGSTPGKEPYGMRLPNGKIAYFVGSKNVETLSETFFHRKHPGIKILESDGSSSGSSSGSTSGSSSGSTSVPARSAAKRPDGRFAVFENGKQIAILSENMLHRKYPDIVIR